MARNRTNRNLHCLRLSIWLPLFFLSTICHPLALSSSSESSSHPSFRVCIVGAGVGGSSAAYFLRNLSSIPDIEIHVFEKHFRAGGRASLVEVDGEFFEGGASIIHSKNLHLVEFADFLGLEKIPAMDSTFGIWDGDKFVFREITLGDSYFAKLSAAFINAVNLAFRYTPWGLAALQRVTQRALQEWLQLYDLDSSKNKEPFSSPEDLLQALGLLNLTSVTLSEALLGEGVPPLLIHELVTAVSRIQYGQSPSMSALAGIVGLIGTGGELWQVKGGNWLIPAGLLTAANASLHFNSSVTSISRIPPNISCTEYHSEGDQPLHESGEGKRRSCGSSSVLYEVVVKKDKGGEGVGEGEKDGRGGGRIVEEKYECDAVIVASAFSQNGLEIFPLPANVPFQPFQHTHVTFVRGILNNSYFGAKEGAALPGTIGTTENPDIPFSSISRHGNRDKHSASSVFKIFSRQALPDTLLSQLFRERTTVKRFDWAAYPKYIPPERFSPFLVDNQHLYYINTIETAASAMETAAVGAERVVRLLLSRMEAEMTSNSSCVENVLAMESAKGAREEL